MKSSVKIGIGVVVVIGAIAAFQYRQVQAKKGPTAVKIEAVDQRDLTAVVLASGKIDAKSRVSLSSEVTGRILRITVREGDHVEKGQLLFELDPAQYRSAVDRAEAQITSGEASLIQARNNRDQAKVNLDRLMTLQKTAPGGVTSEQVEQAQNAYANSQAMLGSSEAQVKQTRASLQEAQDNLARTKILAPISGRVVRLAVEEGEVAQPGTFSRDVGTLMNIADLSVIQAKVKVDETNIVRLKLGDSASVSIDAFPDTTFVGRVTRIANSATTAAAGASADRAVDFEVEITLTNPPADVRPDLSMTARIITDSRKQALSIPIIALTARADTPLPTADGKPAVTLGDSASKAKTKERDGVFVVTNGLARFRPVKVGIAGDEYFEVLDGLKAGDSIVTGSYQAIRALKDSTRVKPDSTGGMIMTVKKP